MPNHAGSIPVRVLWPLKISELFTHRNFGSRGAGLHREFRFRGVFPASQDPASERDPRAGLSPISFLKRNGEPSVSGTGFAAQKVTDASALHQALLFVRK